MRKWNPTAIPDTAVVPDGAYIVDIENIEEVDSRSGKMMYKATLRIAEGDAGIGLPMFENFVMGSNDDPQWQDPATVGPGARPFKTMLKKAGIDISNEDVDECIQQAIGQRVGVLVQQETDDGSADPKYKGTIRNRIASWFSPGERELGGTGERAAPRRSAAPTPLRPVPKPAAAPAKAAPSPATSNAPMPAAAKPAATADTLRCSICNQQIARRDFKVHVDSCEG